MNIDNLLYLTFFIILSVTSLYGEDDSLDIVGFDSSSLVKSDIFYDSVSTIMEKNKTLKLIHDVLFVAPHSKIIAKPSVNIDKMGSEYQYRDFEGKVIGSINVKSVDFLNGNIYDTTSSKTTVLGSAYLKLHGGTRDWVIRKLLSFRVGDSVNAINLAESERYLRDKRYISDVRIVIIPNKLDSNTVDIIVIKRDKIPHSLDLSFSSFKEFGFGVKNNNFFGLGSDFNNKIYYENGEAQQFGYSGRLGFNNMFHSYIYSSIDYNNRYDYNEIKGTIGQSLSMVTIKNGWGVEVSYKKDSVSVIIDTTIIDSINDTAINSINVPVVRDVEDFWYGRSFRPTSTDRNFSITPAIRYNRVNYHKRPYTSLDSNYKFHNVNLYLSELSTQHLRYFKSTYINSFGVTEDIPFGYKNQVAFGYEDKEYRKRFYGHIGISAGYYFNNFGYLSAVGKVGSYFKSGNYSDAIGKIKLRYFSPLINMRKYHLRQLIYSEYTLASNIEVNGEMELGNMIKDLSEVNRTGRERVIIQSETILFTPWFFYGFKFAPYLYGDIGFLTPHSTLFDSYNLFSTIGFGFRIRNSALAFDSYNVRLSYSPKNIENSGEWSFRFSTSIDRVYSSILINRPTKISY